MLLIQFAFTLVWASPEKLSLVKLPADLIFPIVSGIGSYKDLVALNTTSKTLFPLIRPIFDFATACQVALTRTWPSARIRIQTDQIKSMNECATHLMHYSYLYNRVSLEGNPTTVAALFSQITASLESSVDISFFELKSLNAQVLSEVIQSITVGSVYLDLFRQTIDQKMVNILTKALDSRITIHSPINGILFDLMDQVMPENIFANFFRTLPHSKLDLLFFTGALHINELSQLAAVMPQSNLKSFRYTASYGHPVAELQAIGFALAHTPTMKKVVFRFIPSCGVILESMISGLGTSNLEELELSQGSNMDSAAALITDLPPTLNMLNFAGNRIKAATIVNLFGVISRSNVKVLSLFRNHAHLENATQVQQISDYILASSLQKVYLSGNEIDAEGEIILETAGVGRTIMTREPWE